MAVDNDKQLRHQRMETLKKSLVAPSVQEQFENALKENASSFVASIIDLYNGDNYLQGCDPNLVIAEALKAAVLKLPINKSLGFAYIIPYKKGQNGPLLPQFQIGYKGLIQLALRTSSYRIMHADVVFEGEYKSKNKLTGEFDLNGVAKSDVIIGYFCHFEMHNGFSKTLYMTKDQVTRHAQKYSKSFNLPYGPWKTEFDAMATKTVIRGLLGHWGMLSTEMLAALKEEEDVADRVTDEISQRGNNPGKEMSFENVEEAHFSDNGQEGEGGPDF